MTDGSEKRKHQLAFELQISRALKNPKINSDCLPINSFLTSLFVHLRKAVKNRVLYRGEDCNRRQL